MPLVHGHRRMSLKGRELSLLNPMSTTSRLSIIANETSALDVGGSANDESRADQANGEDETGKALQPQPHFIANACPSRGTRSGQWSVSFSGDNSTRCHALDRRPNSTGFFIVLSHIISQLRPGADLSRVTLPTFILEPRSMLERITKYGCALKVLGKLLLTFYPASWHIQSYSYLYPRSKIQSSASCPWSNSI